MDIRKRLANLERYFIPPKKYGQTVFCDLTPDLSPEEAKRKEEEAEREAGPEGMVIVVVHPDIGKNNAQS